MIIRVVNSSIERRVREDGKIDVFGKSLERNKDVWLGTVADDNLADLLIESTYSHDYLDVDVKHK